MTRFTNSRKNKFLDATKKQEVFLQDSTIASRIKFNFSFLDEQQAAGCSIRNLDVRTSRDILEKIKEFSKKTIEELKKDTTLKVYGAFPSKKKTKYMFPVHVPSEVKWARFRMTGSFRLVGFFVPNDFDGRREKERKSGFYFDTNTFYVVFIDKDHKFWISQKK